MCITNDPDCCFIFPNSITKLRLTCHLSGSLTFKDGLRSTKINKNDLYFTATRS